MDLLGQELNTKSLLKMSVDAMAMHQILHYIPHNTKDERIKIASGLTMLGAGYILGPSIHQQFKNLQDQELSDILQSKPAIIIGGAIAGAVAGKLIGNYMIKSKPELLHPEKKNTSLGIDPITGDSLESQIYDAMNNSIYDEKTKKIGPILTAVSIGWLGYSVLGNGKTEEERQRQLYGLACGAAGYILGPKIVHSIEGFTVKGDDAKKAAMLYNEGAMLLGAALGAGAATYGASSIQNQLKKISNKE